MNTLMSRIDQVGYSRLDDAGVQQIVDTQIAKFDLRNGVITRSMVGLEGDSMGPAIGGADNPDLLLVIDGPKGRDVTTTRTIMIGAFDRYTLDEIVYWRHQDTLDGAIAELREGITRWGFSRERVEGWAKAIKNDSDEPYKIVVSSGVSPTGLITSVEVSYKIGKPIVLRYIVHISPGMYEPKNIEAVQRTGQTDYDVIRNRDLSKRYAGAG